MKEYFYSAFCEVIQIKAYSHGIVRADSGSEALDLALSNAASDISLRNNCRVYSEDIKVSCLNLV